MLQHIVTADSSTPAPGGWAGRTKPIGQAVEHDKCEHNHYFSNNRFDLCHYRLDVPVTETIKKKRITEPGGPYARWPVCGQRVGVAQRGLLGSGRSTR